MNTIDTFKQPCDLAQAYASSAEKTSPTGYFRYKPLLGRVLAALLLVPGLPLIGILILLVRTTSRGPALFRQSRVGYHGRIFTMLKIRTMVIDAEAKTGPVWCAGNDPRITPLGHILRKLHLDELPQLFNVLMGEMSLVGPRPERPEIAVKLAESIPGYWRRLAVLPGITGLSQVNLPADSDLDSVRRKLVLDLAYIQESNFQLDLRLFLWSALRLLGCPGQTAVVWLGLRREVVIPTTWYTTVACEPIEVAPSETARESRPRHLPASKAAETLDEAGAIEGVTPENWSALRAIP